MRPALTSILLIALAGCGPQAPQKQASADSHGPAWQGPHRPESPPTGKLDRSHEGAPAPDVEFQDPEGERASFADFRGKPLLVNLWATWCAPCVEEMPTLDALAAREGDRLQVLALSQDIDGRAKVEAFFAKQQFTTLEAFLDPKLAVMAELGIATLPTTILYDSDGREVWRMTGLEDWESRRNAALIEEAFAG